MHFVVVPLFFSIVLSLTQAADLSIQLNQPPLSETVYIFDVKSDAPIEEIKASFNVLGEQPRHSFRAIGENTYYFVVANNSTEDLRQLTFPGGSDVTQYPVAHIGENMKHDDEKAAYYENDTADALPDTVLFFAEFSYHFQKGTPVQLFDLMLSGMTKQLMKTHTKLMPLMYIPIAFYPKKVFGFTVANDNAIQRIVKNEQDVLGGIGVLHQQNKHVVKI